MSDISTISDFLRFSQAQYQVYDLGRRITRLDNRQFEQIERVNAPAPYPILRSLCIAILFWYPGKQRSVSPDSQFVWFLRFPLDETGHLAQVARDEFLRQLLDRVGVNIESAQSAEPPTAEIMERASDESRFAFTPSDEQRAVFHAKAMAATGMPPSRHYAHAVDYIRGIPGYDQWAFVGLQGLADVCANIKQHEADLISAIPQLPAQALSTICTCLDSEVISGQLTSALQQRLNNELSNEGGDRRAIPALVRACASSRAKQKRSKICRAALQSGSASDVELLATIAGRCWEELADPAFCLQFLEALASNENGQPVFDHLVADLMFLPGMRDCILTGFRNPDRSESLSAAIGQFFSALKQ